MILPILEISYKSLTEGCIHCSENEREHRKREGGAQVPQWKSREPLSEKS